MAVMLVGTALAMPVLPTGYYGYVKDSAGNPIGGVRVAVKDSTGTLVGRSELTNSEGLYSLTVLWDDSETGGDEGVISGEQIRFFVSNGLVSTVTVAEQGSNNYLDFILRGTSGGTSAKAPLIEPEQEQQIAEEIPEEEPEVLNETPKVEPETHDTVVEPVNEPPEIIQKGLSRYLPTVIVLIIAIILIGLIIFVKVRH